MSRSPLIALVAAVAGWVVFAGTPTVVRAADADGSTVPPATSPASPPLPPSFRNDVMPVLSKAGCNMGACHGNKNGKGGLKLSLRGESPLTDFDALTRDVYARRVDPFDPDHSLILLKATNAIAHEGNRRFGTDAPEYATLRAWIDAGTPRDVDATTPKLVKLDVTPSQQVLVEPADRVQIKAIATFSDGSTRDVSRLAVYEQSQPLAEISLDGKVVRQKLGETAVVVRFLQLQKVVRLAFVPGRPDFVWGNPAASNLIDEHVFAKLKTLRMNPSAVAGDEVFVRRAYLDLLGLLPTAGEAQAFVADASQDKRTRLVDALLARPEYADYWAVKWADLLRVEERTLDKTGVEKFHGWIRQAVADNMPVDQFCKALVTATGSTYANPPANYYRALRDPVSRGEAAAQVFLGTRLQCAQCHNHPFDKWTQDDYFGWADVFSQVDYKVVENKRKDKNDSHEFIGEQVVLVNAAGTVADPRTNAPVKAAKLLGAPKPLATSADRLQALGSWLTGKDNRLFAKAQVNRIWSQLMGKGLVDPVDDFRATNPATHPELLEALTDDFVAHGYDAKRLIRLITASRTYQLAAEPNDTNRDDENNYARDVPRRLGAEQMTDALHQVAGVQPEFAGYAKGTRASQVRGVMAASRREGGPMLADTFLVGFGKPPRQLSCDCERSNESALGQTFQLVSGPLVAKLLAEPGNRIDALSTPGKADAEVVDELYWTALTRPPTGDEKAGMVAHLANAKDRRKALEDVVWALVNAKEFLLRR
jgi:hypothetical protein